MAQASSWVQVVMDNEEENDRLAEQHEIFKDAMGGKLVLAPVDLSGSAVRVLDSGASDGELLVHTLKSFLTRTNNQT